MKLEIMKKTVIIVIIIVFLFLGFVFWRKIKKQKAEAYYNKGNVYRSECKYDNAIDYFEKTIKLIPDFKEAYYYIAWSYQKKGEIDKANEYYAKAYKLKSYFASTHQHESWIEKNKEWFLSGIGSNIVGYIWNIIFAIVMFLFPGARRLDADSSSQDKNEYYIELSNKIKTRNEDFVPSKRLGIIEREKEQNEKRADSYNNGYEGIKYGEGASASWGNRGKNIWPGESSKEREDLHEKWYSRLRNTWGGGSKQEQRSGILRDYKRGDCDEAIKCYEKAIELNPKDAEAYNGMGNAYYKIGKYNEAIECYEKAIELNPKDAEACNGMGSAYYKIGKYNEAIKYYKKAIKLEPNDAKIHNSIGSTYYEISKYNEAIKYYKKAVKLKSDYADAYHNMGLAYQYLGNQNEATDCFQRESMIRHKERFIELIRPTQTRPRRYEKPNPRSTNYFR